MPPAKEQFLAAYEREHGVTMSLLRAYPADKLDLRPHPRLKNARELAWVFALESYLGTRVYNDDVAKRGVSGNPPSPPENWSDVISAIEKGHKDFGDLVRSATDEDLLRNVQFFTGPKTMGNISRIDLLWFLLSDQIHHRGQFSIY